MPEVNATDPTPSEKRPSSYPKPLLASEVLADERAPLQPGRQACRWWLFAVALGLVLVGLALRSGVGWATRIEASTIAFSAAGATATLAALPFPYALRAGISLLVGGVLMGLGLRQLGPLAGLAIDGGQLRDGVRLITLTVLPAALMLRARYAGFGPSRWVLVGAMLASIPFLSMELLLVAARDVSLVIRISAALSAAAVAASAFALTGDGSLGNRSPVAWLVLVVLPAQIGLRELTPLASPEVGWLTYPLTAFALLLASVLTSMGTYQLGATVFGPKAQEGLRKKLRPRRGNGDHGLNPVG